MNRRALAFSSTIAMLGALVCAPPSAGEEVDRAPVRTIDVPGGNVWGVAADEEGLLYVTREDNAVAVYAPGATGTTPPLRLIQGADTQLNKPRQPAIDPQGRLLVPSGVGNAVSVFPAGATGNASPVRALTEGLSFPTAVAVDGTGDIYVTNYSSDSVTVYEATQPGTGADGTPIRTIQGSATGLDTPTGIAVAPNGDVYVASYENRSVSVFGAGSNGNVPPKRTITSADALFGPESVALDSSGNVYVTNFEGGVAVFGPGARGEAAPKMYLLGEDTGLGQSFGAVLNARRFLTVANQAHSTVTTYRPLVPLAAPGRVRDLVVKGTRAAVTRAVDWLPPVDDGGAPVTSYRVEVRKGGSLVLARTVEGSSVKLRRADLVTGTLTVQVRARNSVGFGEPVRQEFVVRT